MLVDRLIIFIARKLNTSPLIAHIYLMCLVFIGCGFANPDGWNTFTDPVMLLIFFGISFFVVFLTWVMKGEDRKYWTSKKFWKDENKESVFQQFGLIEFSLFLSAIHTHLVFVKPELWNYGNSSSLFFCGVWDWISDCQGGCMQHLLQFLVPIGYICIDNNRWFSFDNTFHFQWPEKKIWKWTLWEMGVFL